MIDTSILEEVKRLEKETEDLVYSDKFEKLLKYEKVVVIDLMNSSRHLRQILEAYNELKESLNEQ